MTRTSVRALFAALAAVPLLVVGAAQASAVPVITPGDPGGPIDGQLTDDANLEPYQCVVVGQPGVGYASNAAGEAGQVMGTFTNEGPVTNACYGPMTGFQSGVGYVQ
ncbi:MAG: hypothetical protein WAX14_22115 [Rhodococcus sp. (in: high G+C Gram-positive bacteria)]|uniref:hypothetical protein n=1 Tax=Rhodococcus sp. TaxID=1831 RepID=UPI003BB75BEB